MLPLYRLETQYVAHIEGSPVSVFIAVLSHMLAKSVLSRNDFFVPVSAARRLAAQCIAAVQQKMRRKLKNA